MDKNSKNKKFFYIRQDREQKLNELYNKFKKEDNVKSFSEFGNRMIDILYDLLITPKDTPLQERIAELKKVKNTQLQNIDVLVRSIRSSENINLYVLLALYNKLTVEGWQPSDLESITVTSQNEELNQLLKQIGDLVTQDAARGKEIKDSHKKS
ncbi:hypothetical protein DB321_07395 [Ligilactobacillus salivarius]|uniref:Uncharacterized protein n=2 Tax=Ligilactobacillus salivarius TaxID=1624 RepID=A0A6A8LQQ6_9LACO|nr:hypothetical protein [Ligilactobacillus salivarius]ATP38292.1 hypothetical protein CR531_09020 [Ligilactobacillus salivarius]EEJ73686.1 hypothetical protein HMPREF0545_1430 [Ligilactobacillus salivarius DSM 20555 = ATCC 11741]KRM69056.1 hypothetical protein FC55_GL000434 [Ligilactobacillus salivarius DSM 20555 = ATCC 11741]MBE7938426.1 hypothetical protein [Ligilactobacillus salivarius]MDG9755522.1 hypothetical protein [Ligilactobacillus salivarius]